MVSGTLNLSKGSKMPAYKFDPEQMDGICNYLLQMLLRGHYDFSEKKHASLALGAAQPAKDYTKRKRGTCGKIPRAWTYLLENYTTKTTRTRAFRP